MIVYYYRHCNIAKISLGIQFTLQIEPSKYEYCKIFPYFLIFSIPTIK